MNIAIVDDLSADRRLLAAKIDRYMNTRHLPYTLYEFDSAEHFLSAFRPGKFAVIFMDIYMTGMTGMDAAIQLRNLDSDCRLIFLTVSEEYLRQGYSVNAVHYLIKPVKSEEFEQAMKFCRIKPQYAVPYLDVVSGGINVHLDTGKILYVNIQKRIVHIHTLSQSFQVAGTFTRVTQPLLADKRFLLCIQGVLVNMDAIIDQVDSMFILKNGEQVHINLRNRRSVIQEYRRYMFENMH